MASSPPFPPELLLTPVSRRPFRLPESTVRTVLAQSSAVSIAGCDRAFKRASIIVVTYNNLVCNRLCLESVLANTDYPNYQILLVDNGSSDGTIDYLQTLSQQHKNVRVILNAANRGFAPANNQGLAQADGEVLVLLNNDTLVPRGWLTRLASLLQDSAIGLIGPVTNRIGNEAQIDVPYKTYGEFERFARDHSADHENELFEIRMLAMFCVAMRRDVYERVGQLDERFELGTFEDEDYSVRVRQAGYRVICTESVFVHHFGQASFGDLVPTGDYSRVFQANRRRFEQKWNVQWESHQHRPTQAYQSMIDRIRELVRESVPPGSMVIFVSKGNEELINVTDRRTVHFPQDENGNYAAHYPADSAEAINQLENLRKKGAEYLVVPRTALWWFDHYAEFGKHIESRHRTVAWHADTCAIFELCDSHPVNV